MLHLNSRKRTKWLPSLSTHTLSLAKPPTLNTAIWPTNLNWYIKGLPCWVYSRRISRSYNLLFERNCLQVSILTATYFAVSQITTFDFYSVREKTNYYRRSRSGVLASKQREWPGLQIPTRHVARHPSSLPVKSTHCAPCQDREVLTSQTLTLLFILLILCPHR